VQHYYWPTYAFSAWSFVTGVVGYSSILVFFYGVCIHISAQFDVASARLETLVQVKADDVTTSDMFIRMLTPQQNKEVQEKLRDFVKQHNALIELCDLMSQSFSLIIVFHLVSSAVLISTCCLLLFLTEEVEFMQYFFGTLSLVAEAFVFAYAGHTIISSSSALQDAAYNFDWYKCDTRNRKMILMIMIRAQKKICMKAPLYFEASLKSFGVVSTWQRLSNELLMTTFLH